MMSIRNHLSAGTKPPELDILLPSGHCTTTTINSMTATTGRFISQKIHNGGTERTITRSMKTRAIKLYFRNILLLNAGFVGKELSLAMNVDNTDSFIDALRGMAVELYQGSRIPSTISCMGSKFVMHEIPSAISNLKGPRLCSSTRESEGTSTLNMASMNALLRLSYKGGKNQSFAYGYADSHF